MNRVMTPIPFNRPHATGREFDYIREAIARAHIAGDGIFSRRCQAWLEEQVGCVKALLTHSCTGALEMAALLGDIQPGDEVIMPSFTFVSTANAFVLRGGVPVFVDIRPDTLNLDERAIAAAVTPRTRAIVAVHYAGVPCEMDEIVALARRHNLLVIEDAAQALGSTYKDRPAGRLGDLAATSFHETKNVTSGEGGALLINAPEFAARAEIIRDKGTNRSRFLRGEIDKYTWIDVGLVLRAERARRRLPVGADGGRGRDHRAAPGDLDLVLRGVRSTRAPRPPAAAHRPRTLPPQRPHVLRDRLPDRETRTRLLEALNSRRGQRGVSLRAAALVGGRPPVRTNHRRFASDRQHQRAADPISFVDRDGAVRRRPHCRRSWSRRSGEPTNARERTPPDGAGRAGRAGASGFRRRNADDRRRDARCWRHCRRCVSAAPSLRSRAQ